MSDSPQHRDMLGRAGVPSLADAVTTLHDALSGIPPLPAEAVPLADARGRVLAAEVTATEDIPPHPRSTMDGFAVRAEETFGASESLPAYLRLAGEVMMGECPPDGPPVECCFAIATGGLLPPGANAVVMLEHTVPMDDMVEITRPAAVGENVIGRGDDVRAGEALLAAGHRLRPQDIGLLAGLGITEVKVHRRVRIGIFSTGDEIVPHTGAAPPGKIRDMNSITLAAMAEECGAEVVVYGIVRDREDDFLPVAAQAARENDIVLFSGGSSVGVRDLGEKAVRRLGKPGMILHGVAIKPGKPVIFALAGNTAVFGMPGHPVSAAMAFRLFVAPAIRRVSGAPAARLPEMPVVGAVLERNINSAPGRTDFVQAALGGSRQQGFSAMPILGKSGALSTLVRADGFFVIEESCQGLEAGETVEVFLYP